ncbi:BMP family lipoprotein [Leucothrix pacifica]|uniref:BMP family ABC transporter substrate-binding protein n=1 Tax=Leucothrix pacifica TaxID=1247513 RepID=A0A317CNT5_9GAMM|nr:BMP family ABC transporter substrate-binding protein [Leucothrix pacifica]PWQ97982.1 BMP family ABC transporter substrate-binding protein [Leucothrix pacifica]
MKRLIPTLAIAGLMCTNALANDISPAVVYDKAGKNDKSFNEAVYNGILKFTKDTDIKVREVEPTNEAQVSQGLSKLAKRKSSPIVAVGFSMANALEAAAKEFPETKFTIIDMVVEQPNVQSVVFAEHEGSFLVGALAAMKSESAKVGFIGGMDIPLIRKFACGYEQGAKYQNASVEVMSNMIGSTGAAFNNPSKGGELAKSQFDKGADVVFAAAGGSGTGVYQAAKDGGKYAIGVDSNQNHLQPGTMLTSMVKRVGDAAYSSFMDAKNGEWEASVKVMDLKAGGVDWALDEHNRDLITPAMEKRMGELKALIASGYIKVHDYMSDNTCTY